MLMYQYQRLNGRKRKNERAFLMLTETDPFQWDLSSTEYGAHQILENPRFNLEMLVSFRSFIPLAPCHVPQSSKRPRVEMEALQKRLRDRQRERALTDVFLASTVNTAYSVIGYSVKSDIVSTFVWSGFSYSNNYRI